MSGTPRVVIGAPLYNRADFLPAALDSLLGQSHRDFLLVLVDDCSSDETPTLAQRFATQDSRVVYRRNARRLGMTENWRQAFLLGRELCPEMDYFAWASDHDLWEPDWLACLLAELEARPETVLAYPLNLRISESGEALRPPWRFDTSGRTSATQRFLATTWNMVAADMVYGLYRADALARAGIFRSVLLPDRLLLAELALQGQFRQVPRVLWRRRFRRLMSNQRQRAAFFPDGSPWWARLPWWIIHAAVLGWNLGLSGTGRARLSRSSGLLLALVYLCIGLAVEARSLLRRAWTLGIRKPVRKPLHRARKQAAAWRGRVARQAARLSACLPRVGRS